MSYVELRAHTAFSFGDGAVTPEVLVQRAHTLGYHALGITDSADLGALVRASVQARDGTPLKLIAGAEFRVDGRPLAVLARNKEGCQHLCALITQSRVGKLPDWKREHPGPPRGMPALTWEQLEQYADGLYCLTGPASGHVAAYVQQDAQDDAVRWLRRCQKTFDGHVSIEVQDHHTGGREAALAARLVALANELRMRWVVTHDPRYVDRNGRMVHDILTALRAGCTLQEAANRGILHANGEWQLRSPETMRQHWAGCEAGLDESVRIASLCEFDVKWLRPPLPDFPGGGDAGEQQEFLRQQVERGAEVRWGTINAAQRNQIEHELAIIGELGFAGFFLVMWDAVHHAREHLNILCQGRGSAANSAVAYCLGITAVDPVKHGLLFERFLSGVRMPGKSGDYTEAPDIDVDIEHKRREEVLDYMYGKYERQKSAIACIVQTYRARNALLDTMRVFGYPAKQARLLSKRFPRDDPSDGVAMLQNGLAEQFELRLDDARGRALLAVLPAFQDLPRMRGTHVGGFVLSSKPLGAYLPIEHTTMGRTIIQFDKDDLDVIGVPKFDFLGLGALTHVKHAFHEIRTKRHTSIELYNLPDEDKATFDMIAAGDTLGTFQIESRAQISSIVHTRPDKLYDIVIQIALVRPGPIQGEFVGPYTRRRRGGEVVTYSHPALEPILKRTQGVPIFQEQAMAISMELGVFTPEKADQLRRLMGNERKEKQLAVVLEHLKQCMLANDKLEPRMTLEVAEKIERDLRTFSNFGFPESHSWSFALISYATAYLKQHYPAEFYMGLLNAYPMGFYQPSTLIHDARRHGVVVRAPCLRVGQSLCTTEETHDPNSPALRLGWKFIRGIKERTLDRLEQMQRVAPFTSIADVVERSGPDRAEVLQFARADAFAAWEPDRRRAAWLGLRVVGDGLPLAPAHEFDYLPRPLDARERIFMDYHATGICVSGHPMEHLRERLNGAGAAHSAELSHLAHGANVVVAGLVTVRQRPGTANGTIFLLLEDEFGAVNVVVSAELAEQYRDVVRFAPFLVVQGRVLRDDPAVNILGLRFNALVVNHGLTHQVHNFH